MLKDKRYYSTKGHENLLKHEIMLKDKHITEVMFRKNGMIDNKGEIYALFPHLAENKSGCVSSYQHVGQHIIADYDFCMGTSTPASQTDYADLQKELEQIGYNLKVVRKQNRAKYLKIFRAM